MLSNIVLIIITVFIVIFAGLFSGSETGMYRLSRLRLRLGVEKRRLPFVLLGKAMDDSTGLLLSMLTGTNLAHYLVTSIVTFLLLGRVRGEHTAELFATILITPTLFVFSELIPKNIFFYRADYLMPLCAPFIFVFHKICCFSGVVGLLKIFSRLFARLIGTPVSPKTVLSDLRERHIRAILRETQEEGFLSTVQTDIINRVVSIPGIHLRSVMVPIAKVQMVTKDSDKSLLLSRLKKSTFTRLPVYDRWPANIVGFINIYETLSSPQDFKDLNSFIKPIHRLPANTTVSDAIDIMQQQGQKIVLVTGAGAVSRAKPIGIATMKDLVEEILGELAEW